MGSIAGASSTLFVGYLLAWTSGNWTLTFYISAGIYLVGAVCWLFLDSHSPAVRETSTATGTLGADAPARA
jgi:ACS family glucarate transporter-like MFS transporter